MTAHPETLRAARGLHGVSLRHIPDMGMQPKARRERGRAPVLPLKAHAQIRCLLAMTDTGLTSGAICRRLGVGKPDRMSEVLGRLRDHGLVESEPTRGPHFLWRLTPAGEAEKEWHRRARG